MLIIYIQMILMSVQSTMVDVFKSAITQLAHLSVAVIWDMCWMRMDVTAQVRVCMKIYM